MTIAFNYHQFQQEHKNFVPTENEFSKTTDLFVKVTEILVDKTWTHKETKSKISEKSDTSTTSELSILSSTNNIFREVEKLFISNLNDDNNNEIDNIQCEINIYNIISLYGEYAIMAISNLIDKGRIRYLQAVELLCLLGEIRHMPTYLHRTWLLEKYLDSKSKYIRDGASSGILYLENPDTITPLKEAISREQNIQVKINMQQVLNSLERLF